MNVTPGDDKARYEATDEGGQGGLTCAPFVWDQPSAFRFVAIHVDCKATLAEGD